MIPPLPELAGLAEAEEIFEALGVPYEPAVLRASRLHVLRRFGASIDAFLAERPQASERERREALRHALRASHAAFAGETPRQNPFAPGLVRLRRR